MNEETKEVTGGVPDEMTGMAHNDPRHPVQIALLAEQKNGKELAAKLVDHLIVMGASVCHLNVETEGAKYQVTVKYVSA